MNSYTSLLGNNGLSSTAFLNVDSEHSKIMRMLISYGLTPTGNKGDDKARLHRFEIELAREELKSITSDSVRSFHFLTISNAEIQELRNALAPPKQEDEALQRENQKLAEERLGENQIAQMNSFFIRKNSKII